MVGSKDCVGNFATGVAEHPDDENRMETSSTVMQASVAWVDPTT